jgi:WD40 repeat protein
MSQNVKLLSGIATAGILAALLLGLYWFRQSGRSPETQPGIAVTEEQISPIFDLAVTADSNTAYSSHADGTIRVWDLADRELLSELTGHSGRINDLALASSETFLVSGGGDGTIRVWNVATEREINVNLPLGSPQRILSVELSADDNRLAVGTESGQIYIWETNTWTKIVDFPAGVAGGSHPVESLAFDPSNPQRLVSGSDGGGIQLWEISNDGGVTNLNLLNNGLNRIFSVAISPDGQRLAAGNYEGDIVIWNLATGQQEQNLDFNGHQFIVSALDFLDLDGNLLLVSSSYDETVKIWDLSEGYARDTITGHNGFVYAAVLTPDGEFAVSGGLDGQLHLENLATLTSDSAN